MHSVCDVSINGQDKSSTATIQSEFNRLSLMHFICFGGEATTKQYFMDTNWLHLAHPAWGQGGKPWWTKETGFRFSYVRLFASFGREVSVRGFRVEATPTLVLVGLPCQELALATCFVLRVCDIWPSAQLWPRTLHALQTFPHKSFEG